MKIRFKLFLGYVPLAILGVFVGLVGQWATHSVGQDFDHAINRTQPVLQALQDIRFQAVKLRADAYRFALIPQVDAADSAERHGAEFGGINAALARYQTLVKAYFPSEEEEAEEIAEKVAEYTEAISEWRLGTISRQAAQERLDTLEKRIEVVLEATEDAAAGELEEFSAYQRGVKEQIAAQERMIMAAGLLAFLISILGGASISKRIARPVVVLRDAVRKLGGGRLDTRVSIVDSTEVGELAQAFNSMAEQLSGSMVSREYVEDIIDSMAEGMVVIDRDGKIQRVNQAFRALLRCADDRSFAGVPASDYLFDTEGLDCVPGSMGASRWTEAKIRATDGKVLVVAMSVASLHSAAVDAGTVVLVQDITERKENEERLSYLARYDSLTGLPNRNLLLDHLRQSLSRQPWKKTYTAILFCDLDRFKFVNDTLGHGIGDVLLQVVSERLRECVRPGDIVARWAGDEFVVLFNDVAHLSDISPLAEKVIAMLSQPIHIGAHEIYVTVSAGASMAPEHASQADELIQCADMAMYAAKAKGKNTYCFYTVGMAERSQEQMQLEGALRRALQEGGQLQVHYQAQQSMDGPLIGFEALVRWQHPELGLIPPLNFLPLAEEAGLMAAIDETVLRIACEQASRWQQDGVTGLRIAVNVSNHLFRRGDLPQLMGDLLAEYALPPSAIELELTEAIVMTDVENSMRTMHRIRGLGVELSIDDFGTGYSSLSHLKRCPIQMLKIDRSFVNDVMTDPNDAAITEAIVALAHKMGIQVIAEGVELEAQRDVLKRYGCDAIQGYLLSKPIPAAMLPAFLARIGHPIGTEDATEAPLRQSVALPG